MEKKERYGWQLWEVEAAGTPNPVRAPEGPFARKLLWLVTSPQEEKVA